MNNTESITEKLYQLVAMAETIARIAERANHHEVSIPADTLDTLMSNIGDTLANTIEFIKDIPNHRADYGNLKPYATFKRVWADGTTYQIRVPRDSLKDCLNSGGDVVDLIDKLGEIV